MPLKINQSILVLKFQQFSVFDWAHSSGRSQDSTDWSFIVNSLTRDASSSAGERDLRWWVLGSASLLALMKGASMGSLGSMKEVVLLEWSMKNSWKTINAHIFSQELCMLLTFLLDILTISKHCKGYEAIIIWSFTVIQTNYSIHLYVTIYSPTYRNSFHHVIDKCEQEVVYDTAPSLNDHISPPSPEVSPVLCLQTG